MAQQVELAVSRLETLSSLPCVAVQLLRQLSQGPNSALAEIIESDAALTAKILSVAGEQSINLAAEKFSISQITSKLPTEIVRDVVLSAKPVGIQENDADRTLPRKQLAIHNIAVACCAKEIATVTSSQINSQLAYTAGLLHDIGKLALDAAMPKSFIKIVEEAKSESCSANTIEQKHLGIDHTILGKRLAAKWRLPNEIILAIWLHHSDTETIVNEMPEAKIAQIVQLADCIARQCDIGQSGSYDIVDSIEQIADSLEITQKQLEQIYRNLPEMVEQKSKALGLDLPNQSAAYCDAIHTTAVQLAQQQAKGLQENRQLETTSSHFDFITEFLSNIDSASNVIEITQRFAVAWMKFYQTGPVCLYLGDSRFPAVAVDGLAESKVIYLSVPDETSAIPKAMQDKFAILNAYDHVGWLLEQTDIEFNSSHTKIIPLLSGNKAIGAIVFELRYPADAELFVKNFKVVTSIAGAVLDVATAWDNQEKLVERLVSKSKQTQPQTKPDSIPQEKEVEVPKEDNTLAALAEMASGAAHELNNPLSVISGRAQLLAKSENDVEKKGILEKIQENAGELAQIINSLMTYAEPQRPRTEQISIKQILDEAVQLTAMKTATEELDIEIDIVEGDKNILVDSAQIVSAIANILANAVESYPNGSGSIKVNAKSDEADAIEVQISDSGCGMDEETLRKAVQPFFSAKPAGRKRGMGLAHAQRLIQLNRGSLEMTSQPGGGTTVIICLPCK